ncbi:MAG: diguanylate cyclase [Prochlorothrix sp.]
MPFSIILCDIDHFKSINDRYGHLQGDKVLAGLVQIFQKHLRPIDLLGRWGGEEFLIVCPQTSLVTACDVTIQGVTEECGFQALKILDWYGLSCFGLRSKG